MYDIDSLKTRFGAEMATLILSCRVYLATATIACLNEFITDNQIEWNALMRLAKIHRVRPVVYKVINQINIPAAIKLRVQAEQMDIIRQNFTAAIETERIIGLLQKHHIDVAPYKGVALSKQFYGDLVSRESSDIDLIVKPLQLRQAI